jgi:hypothetical protein
MKKSSLWAIYCQKNPQFAKEGEVTLTTRGLKKMFDTTWDIAYHEGEPEEEYSPIGDEEALNKLKSIFGW